MAQWVLGADYQFGRVKLRAGKVLDDALYPCDLMRADGALLVPLTASTMARAGQLQRGGAPASDLVSSFAAGGVPPCSFATFLPIARAEYASTVTMLPAGAIVRRVSLEVVTPYSGGAEMTIGTLAVPAQLLYLNGGALGQPGVYEDASGVLWPEESAVVAWVSGSPAAGQSNCLVEYVVPLP